MTTRPQIVRSLDAILGPGAEAMLAYARGRKLLDGIAIGVFRHGQSYIRLLGPGVTENSCFELGSITKIFTIALIDILAARGVLRWDDPVSKYLPGESTIRAEGGDARFGPTLLDLATHRSGLPLHAPNLVIREGARPFERYRVADLEQYIRQIDWIGAGEPKRSYSNVGFAILGYAVERAAGKSYRELLQDEILQPLGLDHTSLLLTGGAALSLIPGHRQSGRLTPRWKQDALAPAGALCSTVADQLRWMEFLLQHPGHRLFEVHRDPRDGMVGMGWAPNSSGDSFNRSGLTGGYCSYIGVSPRRESGVVLLLNRRCLALMEALAENCERGLRGEAILPLHGNYGKWKAASLDPYRDLKDKIYSIDFFWRFLKDYRVKLKGL